MAKKRNSNKIYITRNIDLQISEQLASENGKFIYIQGQGGVGKSTLLKQVLNYDVSKELPTIYINMQESNYTSFIDILLDDGVTVVKNCPKFENIRNIILKEPKLLGVFLERYNSEINYAINEINEENEEWGQYAKAIRDLAKFGSSFWNKKTEDEKKEILKNPEYVLLNAITEDFKERGLFIVDTFEKFKNSNLKTKIKFEENGEFSLLLKEQSTRLKDYIEGLFYLMVEKTTFLIAGRNQFSDLNIDIDEDDEDVKIYKLEQFSLDNIKDYFIEFAKKYKKLGEPTPHQLKTIKNLTQGNPLLVEMLANLAKNYNFWSELDYAEMERRVKEDGLVFYFTNRIISHIITPPTNKLHPKLPHISPPHAEKS